MTMRGNEIFLQSSDQFGLSTLAGIYFGVSLPSQFSLDNDKSAGDIIILATGFGCRLNSFGDVRYDTRHRTYLV